MKYLYTDGGARGNPGPGAAGVVLKNEEKEVIFEAGHYLGTCTNNEAEYQALIFGLQAAFEKNFLDLECYLDSELVVRQLNGEYKVKNGRLHEYFDKIQKLIQKFSSIKFTHVPREKNKQADALVNQVLDSVLLND